MFYFLVLPVIIENKPLQGEAPVRPVGAYFPI